MVYRNVPLDGQTMAYVDLDTGTIEIQNESCDEGGMLYGANAQRRLLQLLIGHLHRASIKGVKVKGGYPGADVGEWHYAIRCSCGTLNEEPRGGWWATMHLWRIHLEEVSTKG